MNREDLPPALVEAITGWEYGREPWEPLAEFDGCYLLDYNGAYILTFWNEDKQEWFGRYIDDQEDFERFHVPAHVVEHFTRLTMLL